MSAQLVHKLIDASHAFDHPVTVGGTLVVAAVLVITPIIIAVLSQRHAISAKLRTELYTRYTSWLVLAPLMLGPILLGPGLTVLAVGLLSLLCYQEFARATGLFRSRSISAIVVLGILALTFAELDHWYHFFVAIPSLTIILIVIVAVLRDQPSGYLQRVALGVLAFLLFGVCLGHLGYMANDRNYRPILLIIVMAVELNDAFAFIVGKSLGRRKLIPHTSPNKTLGGALGALVLTTALFGTLAHFTFRGEQIDTIVHLIAMGLIVSIAGQLGDLVISSVKRDLGIKDMGALIPGHGGLLDRFDSLILVAPALFHYIGYFRGFGLDQPERIITGG